MDAGPWIAIALSQDVAPGSTMPVMLDGRELVVWRSADGALQVWEDRCPHRGMRLSFGFVRGERLACLYHGWRFATDSTCKAIPAHPDLEPPKTIHANAFAACEADGLIWTTGTQQGHAGPPPALPAGLLPVRSITVDATPAALQAGPFATALSFADGLVRVHPDPGPVACLATAVQPVDATRTALHVLAEPAGPDVIGALEAAAAWSERLRDHFARTAPARAMAAA